MSRTYWLTGLPCSGKTTICKEMLKYISVTCKTIHLDGDEVRRGLCSDLGYSPTDRAENIRRVAHMAQMLNENGVTVIASFVSPTNAIRQIPKRIIQDLSVVYVECPLALCRERDVKGMYKKALEGCIKNFTGVDGPFEAPQADFIVQGYGDLTTNTHALLRQLSQKRAAEA